MPARFAFLLVLVAGCHHGAVSNDIDTDLGVADYAASAGCFSLAECAFQCATGDSACVDACLASGTAAAREQYQVLLDCGAAICSVDGDGGAADGGASDAGISECFASTDCTTCVQNKIQSNACSSQFNACVQAN